VGRYASVGAYTESEIVRKFWVPQLGIFLCSMLCLVGSKLQLEDWEYVTCMKHLYLSSEGMHRQGNAISLLNTTSVEDPELFNPDPGSELGKDQDPKRKHCNIKNFVHILIFLSLLLSKKNEYQ
jgi:hypothetical protein